MLFSDPYKPFMEYRTGPAPTINSHENPEIFVIEGSGTMLIGGTLIDPVRKDKVMQATKSEGGVERKLVKGDIVLVPENVVHGFPQIDGRLVMMSMHLPRE